MQRYMGGLDLRRSLEGRWCICLSTCIFGQPEHAHMGGPSPGPYSDR